MTHFGILCPNATGHLNPMIAVGRTLQQRGHRVTFFQVLDGQAKIEAAGLDFWAIGAQEMPLGYSQTTLTALGRLSGVAAMNYSIRWIQHTTEVFLKEAPAALRAAQVDALLVDQISPGGSTIAQALDLPFVSFCCALAVNQAVTVPPFVMPWRYSTAPWAILRNRAGYTFLRQIVNPVVQTVNQYRQAWGLPLMGQTDEALSGLAQIAQHPREFEFPRSDLPDTFHFVGPLIDPQGREPVAFPFEKLTGEPLIYASLGTLQNQQFDIFRRIAQACEGLPAQLVISLGSPNPPPLTDLPGMPLVVPYAPQLDLLQRATLTITHAGLNTVLESLANGVPLVAIPITNDQPGVGARLAYSGAGEVLALSRLTVPRLRTAIQRVLTEERYRHQAYRLKTAIQQTGGVQQAADIVEQVLGLCPAGR